MSTKTTMKAIQVHQFIENMDVLRSEKADEFLSMNNEVPKPEKLQKNQMLVKVLACSISPGDIIMVQGNLIFLHEAFPFVPGMDVCGVVVDRNNSTRFENGDVVVASNGLSPVGGMAEYMAVDEQEAVLKPKDMSNEAGASHSSAITARNSVTDNVKKGDRVLVLGGSGGVGSAAIQIAKKHAKASFVATTSTQSDFCSELGADRVINYRTENWWEIPEWRKEKFDVIIDTVGGGNFYGRADKVLKPGREGGSFVAVTGDEPKPDCRTVWKAIKFFAKMPWRPLYTWMKSRTLPKYVMIMPYDIPESRKQVIDWMQEGTLKIPLDGSPLPFTAEGVRQAFAKVGSGHAHGKVVVSMAKEY